jgi:hypothetical protein|tara:strand:- start:376 stop:615 length:240 start_codon:yes stop_codon:yes gene_type:complete
MAYQVTYANGPEDFARAESIRLEHGTPANELYLSGLFQIKQQLYLAGKLATFDIANYELFFQEYLNQLLAKLEVDKLEF